MLHLDITATLGQTITPSKGIPEQEYNALRTSMRRYVEDWLNERKRGEHAWSMDPYNKDIIKQVKNATTWVKGERIRTVVWIGIGGSGLGPKVIQEMFEGPDTLEFILMDSIDPAMIELQLKLIDWKETLVVVTSKSGGTLEPMSLFFLCWEKLKAARGDRAAEFAIAVTDPQSGTLHDFAKKNGVRMLPIPSTVGGRYSIFTPVGLFPVALLGADLDQFVRGAKELDTVCQNTDIDLNPAAQLAVVQYLLDTKRDYPLRVIMPYAQRLESLARWNQQLIAESLGKTETRNPIPVAAIGTQDQHSLLQQWMQGPRSSWHLFIREDIRPQIAVPQAIDPAFDYIGGKTFSSLIEACYQGTSQALTGVKRPHVTVTLPQLDAYHLGQLFFLLLAEVVFLGKLYRIDPYGQPGVEAGKKITKKVLGEGESENR